jgi:hypothetical protein
MRTYLAYRFVQGPGWTCSGVLALVYDLDTGIVYGSHVAMTLLQKGPGEPAPIAPNERWAPAIEGTVVYCHINAEGDRGAVATEMGIASAAG